ncbi:integrase core domain protein [Plakobranchus ocellatus]|uniref:Integrase core domain protein n=1 Tax=Plakobranchus ocellatus TaxID=259542 RepID=A0AAV3YGP8_9GAST|nr:integrase core domain protein [Plakobranchus ocellatus]
MQGTVFSAEEIHENVIHDGCDQTSGEATVIEQPSVSTLTEGTSSFSTSCVCLKEMRSTHTCQKFTRNVHAICGHYTKDDDDDDVEGYVASILCTFASILKMVFIYGFFRLK